MKSPPPSKRKVQSAEPVEGVRAWSNSEKRKFELKKIQEKLHMGTLIKCFTMIDIGPSYDFH